MRKIMNKGRAETGEAGYAWVAESRFFQLVNKVVAFFYFDLVHDAMDQTDS